MGYVTPQMLHKSALAVSKERDKQINIIYPCAGLVFWRWGWRLNRINKTFDMSNDIWHETIDAHQAILMKLEEETGIELTLMGTDKSYKEFPYLTIYNDDILLSYEQAYYANNRMLVWIPTMLLACLLLVLHRREHYGFDRLNRFVTEVNRLREEMGDKPRPYHKKLVEETGVDFCFRMV